MTQPELWEYAEPTTFSEAVEIYFRKRPNQWIDGMALAQVGGCYAWRSRLSDVRKCGMVIENRQRRVGRKCISEYRWVPA